MKKIVSLLLGIAFVGSMLMVVACAPKQEAQQAPAMEEQAAPVAEGEAVQGEQAPAVEVTPGEQAPLQ